jgi:superfamily II helicase
MTAQDIKIQDQETCEKCASKMIERKMSIRDNGTVHWKKIKQCIACRHWRPID